MITLAAIFSLTINVLFAGNISPVENSLNATLVSLVPATPAEASFEEAVITDITSLAPVAPMTADFSDTPETIIDLTYLAPVTPEEADFSSEELPAGRISLEPVTPETADFNDAM